MPEMRRDSKAKADYASRFILFSKDSMCYNHTMIAVNSKWGYMKKQNCNKPLNDSPG
jgi:hypothetical protein